METKLSLYLFATDDFIKDFRQLCDLSLDQLKIFTEGFKSDEKIDFSESKIKAVFTKLDINSKTLTSSVSVARFIFKKIIEVDCTKEELKIELKTLAEKNDIKLTSKKLSLLVDFFDIPSIIRLKHDNLPYKNSIVPILSTCTALFDIRAIYDDEDKETPVPKSYIPMSIIRIIAEDDKDNKKSIEFQADIEGLENLIGWLEGYKLRLVDLEKKISTLK